jgi:predicted AAA+ superfamily ATPase
VPFHELVSYRNYVSGEPLTYWRSTSGFEVDFILGDHTAIEVKAKSNVAGHDLKSLRALAEERKLKRYLCVSLDPRPRTLDGVPVLPWRYFRQALWSGEFV